MYEDWKIHNNNLIFREVLSSGKKIPIKSTFTKYRPNHVHQLSCMLQQMSCDKCTEFKWWFDAKIKFLCKAHTCGKRTCRNYDESMGSYCKCDDCKNCYIFELKRIDPYDLLDHVLYRSYSTFNFISCASGKCTESDCNIGKIWQLLQNGSGCHTFNGQSESEIAFKFIDSHEVGDKKYKTAS